ncbi:hypothetical protein DR71_887 [Corynebacterium sp. ATCC 6931]|nr:hypothetical protein DR71_887 [Corynebacterium sp. ATCC 6931]
MRTSLANKLVLVDFKSMLSNGEKPCSLFVGKRREFRLTGVKRVRQINIGVVFPKLASNVP